MDAVVPVAVEFMAMEIDAGEVGGSDFDAGRVRVGVDLGMDLEAGFSGGGGDQLDNDLMADERFAAPVLGDEREEAVLDLVPLAGTRRQVADSNNEIEFISELLQFHLPQAQPRSIAATAIGRDGEMIGIGIAGRAHQLPPATDRIDCEAGGVVVDADADPAGVLADVVNPVRHGAALAADEEVVDPHFLRLALRTPFAAGVLEVADPSSWYRPRSPARRRQALPSPDR